MADKITPQWSYVCLCIYTLNYTFVFWSSLLCKACFDIIEQLQLQVEALLFDQDEGSLVEMIDLLGNRGRCTREN